jgi:hypothetical protein
MHSVTETTGGKRRRRRKFWVKRDEMPTVTHTYLNVKSYCKAMVVVVVVVVITMVIVVMIVMTIMTEFLG